MEKLKEILKFAMKMEKQGENFYTYYADVVKDIEVKKMFSKYAEIENSHYKYLKNKYDELYDSKDIHDISWATDTKQIIHPSIFGNAAIQFSGNDKDEIMSDLAVLRMAYCIEDDFSGFYNEAAENVSDNDAKKFLRELSNWEDEHREIFYNIYRNHLKKTWGDLLI